MGNLYEELVAYSESDIYGFHMPGHKRNVGLTGAELPYRIDITEIEGFDDLHHADGILKAAQEKAARLYKAEETCFLINGSTAGILSGIMGCTQKGDKILMARNCHKSAYHAVFLNELVPVYLYPGFYSDLELNGPIGVQDVRHALERDPDIRAIMITSPTYDGVVSDVAGIAREAHRKRIPLIVDEAHGAHFGFHPYFPENANVLGADVVIHSLHKTLPALTQTALLHMNGEFANRREIRQYLHMFQTSSPSYVLMASIDVCTEKLLTGKEEWFDKYAGMLKEARTKLRGLKNLKLAEPDAHTYPAYDKFGNTVGNQEGQADKEKSKINFDRSKIVISVKETNWSSRQLYESLLREYHLQVEMAAGSYVLAMTSVGDTEEGFVRLVKALQEIDERVGKSTGEKRRTEFSLPKLKQIYTCAQLKRKLGGENRFKPEDNSNKECRPKADNTILRGNGLNAGYSEGGQYRLRRPCLDETGCVGCISTEYAYIYPPGIPIIVPGEEISEKALNLLREYQSMGFSVEGLE